MQVKSQEVRDLLLEVVGETAVDEIDAEKEFTVYDYMEQCEEMGNKIGYAVAIKRLNALVSDKKLLVRKVVAPVRGIMNAYRRPDA
jgi:hypothetical protein